MSNQVVLAEAILSDTYSRNTPHEASSEGPDPDLLEQVDAVTECEEERLGVIAEGSAPDPDIYTPVKEAFTDDDVFISFDDSSENHVLNEHPVKGHIESPQCSSAEPVSCASSQASLNVDVISKGITANLELHKDVFNNDQKKLASVWKTDRKKLAEMLELYDVNGLTAIHLAFRLGRLDYMDCFLLHAPSKCFTAKTHDQFGWSVLDEAVVLGNRKYIKLVYLMLQYHQQKVLQSKQKAIVSNLANIMDFSMCLKWEFRSWVPLVSRLLPNDTCTIHKEGAKLRMDSTLLNFAEKTWKHGDLSILYDPVKFGAENIVFIVHDKKQYSISALDKPMTPEELSREVNSLMSHDVIVTKVSSKAVEYTPAKKGMLSKANRVEKVGKYTAQFYNWTGMVVKMTKRRDHLTAEQISKNKSLINEFVSGGFFSAFRVQEKHRVENLPLPPQPSGTFDDYFMGRIAVGRPSNIKYATKTFRGTLAMGDDFPISIDKVIDILKVFSKFRLFEKLTKFLSKDLPPGFPIYMDIPVFPTVMAQVTVQDFTPGVLRDCQGEHFYEIPEGYEKVDDLDVT